MDSPAQTPSARDVYSRLVAGAATKRALVIGDVMLDRYIVGRVSRISPEAPVPDIDVSDETLRLGGAANVAAGLSALGVRCNAFGVVGDDHEGEQLAEAASRLDVGAQMLVRSPSRRTTVKTRVIARNQHVVRLDAECTEDISANEEGRIVRAVKDAIGEYDVLVLQDYNKGVLTPGVIGACMSAAKAVGVPVVVDPKARHYELYRSATVFKPNRAEFEAHIGRAMGLDDVADLQRQRTALSCEHLLITLGSDGMLGVGSEGVLRVPALCNEVVDVTGAGDTVSAAIAASLAVGASFGEAVGFASLAAALAVERVGTWAVALGDIGDRLERLARFHSASQSSSAGNGQATPPARREGSLQQAFEIPD
jgi:D-beta-D-heptose 7-phosphate kinase/D-beta-D-heptose 1-phosphate adenosyltransferase